MSITIQGDKSDPGAPLTHYWSFCVGAGRANEGLRADWLEQMAYAARECGFRYVRFHGIFHDDMFVYREDDGGNAVYNWQYVDILFDRLLAIGVRPFVELGFCPKDLASEVGTVFWWKGNGAPPKDYNKWRGLIREFTAHCIERYGIDEVCQWYFEVWNEPNLDPFFRGTKSQYFELYRVSALAVKELDSRLRVGGPSTSNFVPDGRYEGEKEDVSCHAVVIAAGDLDSLDWRPAWLEEFLTYCNSNSLSLDFISCHPYPTDWALDSHGQTNKLTRGVDATPKDLALLREIVDRSAYPNAEIHLTEWNSSSSPRDFTHDYLQAATYVTKANIEGAGNVDSLSYWTFTDIFEEGGAGDTIFHGGFGMINVQGIVKPTFHAYRFLHSLGDQVLQQTEGAIVTRSTTSNTIAALAYHYPPEMPKSVPASFDNRDVAEATIRLGKPIELLVKLTGLAPNASLVVETLDKEHGNAMSSWNAMGSPEPPTRAQAESLRRSASETRREFFTASVDGTFAYEATVLPWSVVLVREMPSGISD